MSLLTLKLKKATLILNSPIDLNYLKNHIDRSHEIIGIDGGHRLLNKINIKPSLILGDLDSSSITKEDNVIELPDQSLNDFEKSLIYLKDQNYTHLDVFGVFHGRVDHLLNNLNIIIRYQKELSLNILDESYNIHLLLPGENKVHTHINRSLSIFGLDLKVRKSGGLKYPLENLEISLGKTPQGLSNKATQSDIDIDIIEGLGVIVEILSTK